MRSRPDDDARRFQSAQMRRWHMLVVEGDDVALFGERPQVVERVLIGDRRRRDDLCCRIIGSTGQHSELDPERDRRGLGHPGQLTTADHADHRPAPGTRHGSKG